MSADPETLRERAARFVSACPDAGQRSDVQRLLDTRDEARLKALFHPPLRFGTAGVRAPLGAGDARINRVTVRRLVTALCAHLLEHDPERARRDGICVGRDARHGSDEFARDACAIAREHGLPVRVFTEPVPTPLLAFSARRHGCAAALMITASHNPKEDNGIKVYWHDGKQILPPHDRAIAERMRLESPPRDVPAHPCETLDASETDAYLDVLMAALPTANPGAPTPRITYSAMCGVGAVTTRKLLPRLGVDRWHEVDGECEPDPDFGTLVSPNPEHPDALRPGMAVAERAASDLLLVQDPDADRMAVAVRTRAGMVRLTGDEVGCLLGDYLLRTDSPAALPAALVTTLVSSELMPTMAGARGAVSAQVPTGVKWIAQRGRELEQEGKARYVFGYEEAIGYCLPSLSEDKDGVAALALVIRCWQYHQAQGRSLLDARDTLFRAHGVFRTRQLTWRFDAPEQRSEVVERLAAAPPPLLGAGVEARLELDPRAEDLRVIRYGETLRVALRPSGTEPKLKAYLELRAPSGDDIQAAVAASDARLASLADTLGNHVSTLLAH